MKQSLLLCASALLAVGCNKPINDGANLGGNNPSTNVGVSPPQSTPPVDHPPVTRPPTITSASSQRVSIAQLRGTLPVALGNDLSGNPVTWIYPNGKPGLDVVSLTLGEPNYIDTTEEDLSPSPLYLKFMDDLARDACDRVLTADYGRGAAADRSLLRFVDLADTASTNAAGVNQNLRYLKLRLHGVKIDDSDDTTIAPLRDLFARGVQGSAGSAAPTANDVKEGWRVVCNALLTAPEFHIY